MIFIPEFKAYHTNAFEAPKKSHMIELSGHTRKIPETKIVSVLYWLVVSTPLKNMLVKMGSSSPSFGVKIPKIFETTAQYTVIHCQDHRVFFQGGWIENPPPAVDNGACGSSSGGNSIGR